LIKAADPLSKQAKDFYLGVGEAFDESMDLTLYGHPDAVDTIQELEDPT
jgi:hypothetical protein